MALLAESCWNAWLPCLVVGWLGLQHTISGLFRSDASRVAHQCLRRGPAITLWIHAHEGWKSSTRLLRRFSGYVFHRRNKRSSTAQDISPLTRTIDVSTLRPSHNTTTTKYPKMPSEALPSSSSASQAQCPQDPISQDTSAHLPSPAGAADLMTAANHYV